MVGFELPDRPAIGYFIRRGHCVRDQPTVKMIALMLPDPCQEPLTAALERLTMYIHGSHHHRGRTPHFDRDTGQREAAFLRQFTTAQVGKCGIEKDPVVARFSRDIADEESAQKPHLGCSQSDPFSLLHEFEHSVGQPFQAVAEILDGRALLMENGVWVKDDLQAVEIRKLHVRVFSRVLGFSVRCTA